MKCCESSETCFPKLSRRSEPCLRGNRALKVYSPGYVGQTRTGYFFSQSHLCLRLHVLSCKCCCWRGGACRFPLLQTSVRTGAIVVAGADIGKRVSEIMFVSLRLVSFRFRFVSLRFVSFQFRFVSKRNGTERNGKERNETNRVNVETPCIVTTDYFPIWAYAPAKQPYVNNMHGN